MSILLNLLICRREGGLSSIITQLHNKKAIGGSDARAGNREESLDLRVRATSSASPGINGRKRQREGGQKSSVGVRQSPVFLYLSLNKLGLKETVRCRQTK